MARFFFTISIYFLVFPTLFAQPAHQGELALADLQEVITPNYIKRYFKDRKPFTGTTYDSNEKYQTILIHELKNGYIQKVEGWKFSGAKERVYHFKDGLPHGTLTAFYENGQKYFEEHYVEGLQHGKQYGWYEDGSLRIAQEFVYGAEVTYQKYPKPV
ncbi:MAG: hypothetical protein AAF798_21235, partial [Bacteroidota bacterium]